MLLGNVLLDFNHIKYYNRNMILPEVEKALHIIWELEYEMNNPRNCGYTGSDMKKKLWQIKMRVDQAIAKAPEYHGDPNYEQEYLVAKIKGEV
ncbi:MAG: hypothetical protein ACR2M9_00970 [Cyanophyceae cyanobacterium]